MTAPPPLRDQLEIDQAHAVDAGRKSRSSKQFFLMGRTRLGIGLIVILTSGLLVWVARDQLATTSLSAFLRSKGIPANVTIENLQFNTAKIRDLRLGPVERPNLIAKSVIIKWRVDSKAGLFVIERLQVDDTILHLSVNEKGQLNYGALAPLLKPSQGPKRSLLSNVTLSNALVLLDTPSGQVKARLTATGGDITGWRGRADIMPPSNMMAGTALSRANDVPIPLGFALQTIAPTGFGVEFGKKATTLLGFAVRPNGQSLRYQGYEAAGIIGNVTGLVTLKDGGALQLNMRPSKVRLSRFQGHGVTIADLDIATNAFLWNHDARWQTTGRGNGVASGSYARLQTASGGVETGPAQFRLGAAREQNGRTQLDYEASVQRVSGPFVGERVALKGFLTSTIRDLTQIGTANLNGTGQIRGVGIRLPTALRSQLSPTLPPEILTASRGSFSVSAPLSYRVSPKRSQISLEGPLALTGSTGVRGSWVPDRRAAPSLLLSTQADAALHFSGLAAGQFALSVPAWGTLQGNIEGAAFGPSGWAFNGRNLGFSSQSGTGALTTSLLLTRIEATGANAKLAQGRGVGQILVTDPAGSRALLAFDLNATPASISGNLQGPIDGFGTALGLGGYGARRGRLNLTGQAQHVGNKWTLNARGQFGASAISTPALAALQPSLDLVGGGNLTDQGHLDGRLRVIGRATSSQQGAVGSAAGFNGLQVDGEATVNGTLKSLQTAGKLTAAVDRGRFKDTVVTASTNRIQVSGLVSGPQTRLSGTNTLQISRLTQSSGSSSGRVTIANLRASGPFNFQQTNPNADAPFWDGALALKRTRLTTDLRLIAGEVQAGGTRLTDMRLNAPIAVTSTANGWLASGTIDMAAAQLIAGDTRLNGLIASGPIRAASSRTNQIQISTPRCLAFTARSGTFPGDASVGPVAGKLCPNAAGQLALVATRSPRVFATTQLAPLSVQIGGPTGDQRIDIGEVRGALTNKPDGSFNLNLLATQFGFSLKMPDGATAIIKADEASLNIIPKADGFGLQGRLGKVSSVGLPVLLSGSATTNLTSGAGGLSGAFIFDDINLKDSEKVARFGEVKLVGGGTLLGNRISIRSTILEPASTVTLATLKLEHNISTGAGNLDVNGTDLLLSPTPVGGRPGLDIVTLIPPLRGVVSDMVGVANVSANFDWSRAAPVTSRATIDSKGLDFNTMLGPVSGFVGDIKLDDLLTVRTPGPQTIKIGLFDPGLPIAQGTVTFILPGNNSLQLENASWPFADGTLSVRPATWAFRDGDPSFAIDVEDVDLAQLLRLTDVPNLEIDGRVSGVFPIEVRNGAVEIVGGRLKARDGGGMIRYTGPNASPPPPPPSFLGRVRQRLFGKPAPAGADLAIEALRALEYKILEITVDGRITGELQMGVILEGANQQVLSGQPFRFNVKMNVPIGQLVDNLNRLNNAGSSPEVLQEMDRVLREDAAKSGAPIAPPLPLALPQTGIKAP